MTKTRETMIADMGRRHPAAADDIDAILAMPRSDADCEGVRWQRVNDEPFEYAIQQGQFGDEFVKLLNGTSLRRALSPSHCTAGRREETIEECAKICRQIAINAERRAATHITFEAKQSALDKQQAANECEQSILALTSEQSGPTAGREELAAIIHKARWPVDRAMAVTPFADEDRNGREYCFRIADAVRDYLTLTPSAPDRQHDHDETSVLPRVNLSGTDFLPMDQVRAIDAALAFPSAEPVAERAWISPIVTVADLVNNLLTLDQTMEAHGAYFIDHPAVEDRCRTRNLSLSRERVANNRVQTNNEALPWSLVIWSAQEPASPPVSDASREALEFASMTLASVLRVATDRAAGGRMLTPVGEAEAMCKLIQIAIPKIRAALNNSFDKTGGDRAFYGAECPSYPNCAEGCGLGCTKEIESGRGKTDNSGEPK